MTRRIALLLPWCELAATFLPHDPASAERIVREAMWAARGCTCAQTAEEFGHDAHWWRAMFGCNACSDRNFSHLLMFDARALVVTR